MFCFINEPFSFTVRGTTKNNIVFFSVKRRLLTELPSTTCFLRNLIFSEDVQSEAN